VYLLDTNICIALLEENTRAIREFMSKQNLCYVSTIVVSELYKGVYCSTKIERNLNVLVNFWQEVFIFDFDRAAAEEFGKIQGELRKKGKPTGEMDALIAAMARSRGDVLVTNNVRHFENIAGLTIANWLEE